MLKVSQPAGDVVLDGSDRPIVLVSAGIGITPAAAIPRTFRAASPTAPYDSSTPTPRSTITLSARATPPGARDERCQGQNWYEQGADEAPTLHPARSGFMDLSDVELPDDAEVFMCGPLPFMQAIRHQLIARGVPADRIQYEVFGPDLWAQNPD